MANCCICNAKIPFSGGYPYDSMGRYMCIDCNNAISYVSNRSMWRKNVSAEYISKQIEYLRTVTKKCIDGPVSRKMEELLAELDFDGMTFEEYQNYGKGYFSDEDKIENIDNILKVNETKKMFAITEGNIYVAVHPFVDLIDFSVNEDGTSVTSGRSGSATVGALLFGAAGAVVGAAGSKKTTQMVQNLNITLSYKGLNAKIDTIDLINISSPVSKDSEYYVGKVKTCNRIVSVLQQIINENEKSNSVLEEETTSPTVRGKGIAIYAFSVADEILKFKQLYDEGIITEDEFENQKDKLLKLEY